jgi:ATP dependent DNA ligase domain
MLGVSAGRWPDGGRWVLQPKWDGFRLLIEARAGGEVRGWSRHGTDLTARLGSLLAPITEVAPGTTFDGELVAVSERDGKPIQDFAAVTRAVFTGRPAATDRLRFVALDVLAVAGEDVRARPWEDRDACLHETLPVCERIRLAVSQPATLVAHEAIVALGSRARCSNAWGRRTGPDDTAPGSSARRGSRPTPSCVRFTRIATAAGTPSASSMVAVFTRSPAPAPTASHERHGGAAPVDEHARLGVSILC